MKWRAKSTPVDLTRYRWNWRLLPATSAATEQTRACLSGCAQTEEFEMSNDLMPGSSVVEHAIVNRAVAGSTPARAAKKPLIPLCYESACKSLTECLSIDEAQMWDAKADALAAWAKIYHDNEAARKAKALKLHAYRRMGLLSKELTKCKPKYNAAGPVPGARALLIDKGLKVHDADACIRLARARNDVFEKAINSPKPPAPSGFLHKVRDADLSDMALLVKRAFVEAAPFCKKHTAAAVFNQLNIKDQIKLGEYLMPVYEWLDAYMERASKRRK
jgi:hypothetical protein